MNERVLLFVGHVLCIAIVVVIMLLGALLERIDDRRSRSKARHQN